MTETTINDMMFAYAEDAVDFAHTNFGIELDFTRSSLEHVEHIAGQLYQTRPKGILSKVFHKGPSEEEIQQVCKMLGGYIGEIYRKVKGGDWAINQEFQAIGILFGESWVFPPSKVNKRLTNGSEDNLVSYFQVISERLG
jgi:hypothetical protein